MTAADKTLDRVVPAVTFIAGIAFWEGKSATTTYRPICCRRRAQ